MRRRWFHTCRLTTFCGQFEVEQSEGVVISRPKNLPARQIFIRGGNAPAELHAFGLNWLCCKKARQGCPISTQQKNGFDQVATGLLDGQCSQFLIITRAFGHHARNCQFQLMLDLFHVQFGNGHIAPAFFCQ